MAVATSRTVRKRDIRVRVFFMFPVHLLFLLVLS